MPSSSAFLNASLQTTLAPIFAARAISSFRGVPMPRSVMPVLADVNFQSASDPVESFVLGQDGLYSLGTKLGARAELRDAPRKPNRSDPPWLLPSAVAFAIANAPSAVNVARWTRVVHVIAADAAEDESQAWRVPATVSSITEAIVSYATLRFVHGYDAKEAALLARAAGGLFDPKKLGRLFAAYEAG